MENRRKMVLCLVCGLLGNGKCSFGNGEYTRRVSDEVRTFGD